MTPARKYFFFSLLFAVVLTSSAQFDSLAQMTVIQRMEKFQWGNDFQRILDTCGKYLAIPNTTAYFQSKLYGYEANAKSFWVADRQRKFKEGDDVYKAVFREIDSLFTLASETYPPTRTEYFCSANDFFNERDEKFSEKYRDSITAYGFKPEIEAISLSPDFYYGKHAWAGIEFSRFFYDRFCKVGVKVNGKKQKPDVYYPYSCDVLTFGFRKSLNDRSYAFNFSPVSGSWNWINFRPFNFVYYITTDGNFLSYCPEFGVHLGFLFLNYSLNIPVNKSFEHFENGMFNLKLQIPVYKFTR
jgi:hypothetical protein